MSDGHRYRLTVQDRLNTRLVGRRSIAYTSPPQPYDEALVLAGILLDRPAGLLGAGPWFRPIAGGQRSVALELVDEVAPTQLHLDVGAGSDGAGAAAAGAPPAADRP